MAGLILPYRGVMPTIADGVFVAPTAAVIGNVEIGPECSIWFGVTVRGDMNEIRIGRRSNVQDGTVIHIDSSKYGTFIGDAQTDRRRHPAGGRGGRIWLYLRAYCASWSRSGRSDGPHRLGGWRNRLRRYVSPSSETRSIAPFSTGC